MLRLFAHRIGQAREGFVEDLIPPELLSSLVPGDFLDRYKVDRLRQHSTILST